MTMHKLQGMTLRIVEINCKKTKFPGQIRVAVGRAKISEGLSPQYFYTDRSKAVLLFWFLTVLAVYVYTLVHLLC